SRVGRPFPGRSDFLVAFLRQRFGQGCGFASIRLRMMNSRPEEPRKGLHMSSHFFAYLSKLRWIRRWGLKRNAIDENVMEHSWEVATIAHALALIRNRRCQGRVDANAVAAAALFHDASEVITGDLPSPVKYHNAAITNAYKELERAAERDLLALLPEDLRDDYQQLLLED